MNQRARDTADIFTLEFQTQSYGASIRTGPVKIGLHQKSRQGKAIGLRGGSFDQFDDQEFALLFLGSDQLFDSKTIAEKRESSQNTINTELNSIELQKQEIISKIPSLIKLRKKEIQARSPFGTNLSFQKAQPVFKESKTKNRFAPIHHFTAIEATVGLYIGLKIGVNIGELFDWTLGWVGFDPFDDDLPIDLDKLIDQINKTNTTDLNN
ncbi:MAG: hypothetical protein H3C43_11705 [Leptonema sp. (in: Bacteria)]|nr:hypothetical protein [Leptonema sp. (in: bacteria)]